MGLHPRRSGSVVIPVVDALMSAFAMFSLKCSSLLAIEHERNHPNLRRIYRVERAPSDTRMREILDGVNSPLFLFLDVVRFTVLDLMSAGVSSYAEENRRIDELRIHFQDGRCFIRRV